MKYERHRTGREGRVAQCSIELNIQELVLHGFVPGDHLNISDAVRSELSRLFVEKGVPARLVRSAEVSHLDGDAVRVAPGYTGEAIGTRIAQAVYGGLAR